MKLFEITVVSEVNKIRPRVYSNLIQRVSGIYYRWIGSCVITSVMLRSSKKICFSLYISDVFRRLLNTCRLN